jgi:hypothetical protein
VEPTILGLIQVGIGLILLVTGSIPAMFVFMLLSGLFGGSAALLLPALGGSSIPPMHFALVFLTIRILLPAPTMMPRIQKAVFANILLIVYVIYGLLMAYLGPRMFRGQIDFMPLGGTGLTRFASMNAFIYATVPLKPSSQNITTSVYMVGTLLAAISTYIACSYDRSRDLLVKTAACIAWIHVTLGLTGMLAKGTPANIIFEALRNGSYAQLDQTYGTFIRINGIFPEPSSYATYALPWFVFLTETWLRGIKPRWTGPAAMALGVILVFSTSATAYVGLSAYGAILALRIMIVPGSISARRLIIVAALGLGMFLVAVGSMVIFPVFASQFADLVTHMTVGKTGSMSGLQRGFWAKQGINAFFFSDGMGVGPGSFRSSSIITAILGSMGIVGILAYVGIIFNVWKPWRFSTYLGRVDENTAVGVASSWAAISLVLIQSISLPSCDPGVDFAIFAGAALSLRKIGSFRPHIATVNESYALARS